MVTSPLTSLHIMYSRLEATVFPQEFQAVHPVLAKAKKQRKKMETQQHKEGEEEVQ